MKRPRKIASHVFYAALIALSALLLPVPAACEPPGAGMNKVWGAPAPIWTGTGTSSQTRIAFDGLGNAIAVWIQEDGAGKNVYASRYAPGAGWSAAQTIESAAGTASGPQIALDRSGNAIAVWHQDDGGANYSIYANRYVSGSGWVGAQSIESAAGHAHNPQIAFDGSGNAIAVWHQNSGSRDGIYANRYASGSGWVGAQPIESAAEFVGNPQIAFDGSGNAVAVWHSVSTGVGMYRFYADRYASSTNLWEGAVNTETNTNSISCLRLAVDGSGEAAAVWVQNDGIANSIYAIRYTPGAGWNAVETIETDVGAAYSPQIALDGLGNAVTVWHQYDGSATSIYAKRYAPGAGWGAAAVIETGAGHAYEPQIAFDDAGHAVAVWRQEDGMADKVYVNQYAPAAGWSAAVKISTGGGRDQQVAFDGAGRALAVWCLNGTVYANWCR